MLSSFYLIIYFLYSLVSILRFLKIIFKHLFYRFE